MKENALMEKIHFYRKRIRNIKLSTADMNCPDEKRTVKVPL
jgi:hypothetical protein